MKSSSIFGLLGVLFVSSWPALAQDHGNGHGKGHDKHYEEARDDDRDGSGETPPGKRNRPRPPGPSPGILPFRKPSHPPPPMDERSDR